jgi:hypothetical protein
MPRRRIVRPDGYGIWTQPTTRPHFDPQSDSVPETGSSGAHWTERDRPDHQSGGVAALAVLGSISPEDTMTVGTTYVTWSYRREPHRLDGRP